MHSHTGSQVNTLSIRYLTGYCGKTEIKIVLDLKRNLIKPVVVSTERIAIMFLSYREILKIDWIRSPSLLLTRNNKNRVMRTKIDNNGDLLGV